MPKITESNLEDHVIKLLESQNYTYLSPEDQEKERESLSDVILVDRLRAAIKRINPYKPVALQEQALKAVLSLPTQNLTENNEAFHRMLVDGIEAEFLAKDGIRGNKMWLIDFEKPQNNEFVVSNQFSVGGQNFVPSKSG